MQTPVSNFGFYGNSKIDSEIESVIIPQSTLLNSASSEIIEKQSLAKSRLQCTGLPAEPKWSTKSCLEVKFLQSFLVPGLFTNFRVKMHENNFFSCCLTPEKSRDQIRLKQKWRSENKLLMKFSKFLVRMMIIFRILLTF